MADILHRELCFLCIALLFVTNIRINKWLVFVISTLVTMVDFGIVFSFGALFEAIMDTFQTDRATAATVHSILIGVSLSFGVFAGIFISKFGLPIVTFLASVLVPLGLCMSFFARSITFIYVSIGIVSAIGISMAYISCIEAIGREFSGSQQVLCLTILNTSDISLSIIFPYFLEWSSRFYGLNGTFLLLGGISCNTFLLFLVCRRTGVNTRESDIINRDNISKIPSSSKSNVDPNSANESGHSKSNTSLKNKTATLLSHIKKLMTLPYVLVLIATSFSLASLDGFIGLMLDIAKWKQRSSSQALLSFLIYNISCATACIIPGLLKQKKGINSFICPIVCALIGFIALLLVFFSTGNLTYMIGTSLSGVAYGGITTSSMNAVMRIINEGQVPVASGLLVTVEGLLAAVVMPFFGSVFDSTGSYGTVLLTISTVLAISSIIFLLALILRKHSDRNIATESTTELFSTHL